MGQTFTNKQELQEMYGYLRLHIILCKNYLEKMMKEGVGKWTAEGKDK